MSDSHLIVLLATTPRLVTSEGAQSYQGNQELEDSSRTGDLTTSTEALTPVVGVQLRDLLSPSSKKSRPFRERWRRWFAALVLRRAVRYLRRKRTLGALLILRGLADVTPRITSVRIWLARAALADGDPTTAAESIQPQRVDSLPDIGLHYCRLAALHLRMENFNSAARYLQFAQTAHSTSGRMWNLLGKLNERQFKLEDALACFHRQSNLVPLARQKVKALLEAARSLGAAGRTQEAISAFRTITELFPLRVEAYFCLVNGQSHVNADDPLINTIRRLLNSSAIKDVDKSHLHFALAIAYDRSGDVGAAFSHFMLANRLAACRFGPHWKAHHVVGKWREVFTKRMIADLCQYGCQEDFLICIVGMPRSGTTLTEQILTGHSQVRGLGERVDFHQVTERLSKRLKHKRGYPFCCNRLSPSIIKDNAQFVRNKLRSLSDNSPRCVTKRPGDVWELGLIKILFPRARIIHLTRNPVDTCWSCFMQNFASIGYATDLGILAAEYRAYEEIVRHWRDVLPVGSILDVCYETLVAEPEATVRAICDFCEIPFEENCLEFDSNPQPVYTSSHWQVRQPIYQTSVRRSDRYREFLGPLLALDNNLSEKGSAL